MDSFKSHYYKKINEKFSAKIIKQYYPTKIFQKTIVNNVQYEGERAIMPMPWQYLADSELTDEERAEYIKFKRDSCFLYEVNQVGEKLYKKLGKSLISKFNKVALKSFFDFEDCESPCDITNDESAMSRVVGTGKTKKFQCLTPRGEVSYETSCRWSMQNILEVGLKKELHVCLS